MVQNSGAEETPDKRPPTRRLHNFTLPNHLAWGNQKQLRCMKVNPNLGGGGDGGGGSRAADGVADPQRRGGDGGLNGGSPRPSSRLRSPVAAVVPKTGSVLKIKIGGKGGPFTDAGGDSASSGGVGNKLEGVRHKLMKDIKVEPVEADQIERQSALLDGDPRRRISPEEEPNVVMPRKLRPRAGGSNGCGKSVLSPMPGGGKGDGGGGKPKHNFSLALKKEEITADFLAMTGAKPPSRPKRRPKAVRHQLDNLFPGSFLRNVTPEMYEVDIANQPQEEQG